jgi:hypothetical protein
MSSSDKNEEQSLLEDSPGCTIPIDDYHEDFELAGYSYDFVIVIPNDDNITVLFIFNFIVYDFSTNF